MPPPEYTRAELTLTLGCHFTDTAAFTDCGFFGLSLLSPFFITALVFCEASFTEPHETAE